MADKAKSRESSFVSRMLPGLGTALGLALLVFAATQYVRIVMMRSAWDNDHRRYGGAYGIVGEDGRALLLAFLPDSMELFSVYSEAGATCYQLGTVRAAMSNRIIGRVWYGNAVLIADESYEPVTFEYEADAAIGTSCGDSFPPVGTRTVFRADFDGDHMKFQGMTLPRDALFSPDVFEGTLTQLREQSAVRTGS